MNNSNKGDWRHKLHEIVFEADTKAGKAFDVWLLVFILASVAAVIFESVDTISHLFGFELLVIEWLFTIVFTIEYLVRLITIRRPSRYAFSFYGLIDLLAIVPTYLSVLLPGTQSLLVLRVFRLLRVFRILKLRRYLNEAKLLEEAVYASRHKISIFLLVLMLISIVMGSAMHLVEGNNSGFTSIPKGIYWAIVTMTTVGYGDISPSTIVGQVIAASLMILGYAIIAVPTGIVSAQIAQQGRLAPISTQACLQCAKEGHESDATYCKFCGASLIDGHNPGSIRQS